MGLRLLPFRQYNEHDVVNMFALNSDAVLTNTTDDGSGSNGVFVKVSDGNFDQDTISYSSDSYLGKTDFPFTSAEMYPSNPLTVTPAKSGELPLGITLNQTAKNDENGEKLLYNPTKAAELQAVLPGQSVPVATKGIFTLSSNAFSGSAQDYIIGTQVQIAHYEADQGKIFPSTDGNALSTGNFGTIIGSGTRNGAGTDSRTPVADQFSGEFLVIKL